MIRRLLRLMVIIVVLGGAAAFFLGYRIGPHGVEQPANRPVGTTGTPGSIDTARAAGAAIGEKVAVGAKEAQRALSDSALTAKIKSKMALDDSVKASSIDVDTTNGVVTVSGTIRSQAERTRAVQLARETQGVTSVTDHLTLK